MLYRAYGKRLTDVLGSTCALIVAAPFLLGGAVAVWVSMGRPIVFRQERTGRDTRRIVVFKLRTMIDSPDGDQVPDADRLTSVGRWLRRWSIDELPQLWNVLRGDMSLIGPRPLLVKYEPYYSPRELTRFSVRPGITGWAQVNGRNDSPWDERLDDDVWYVEHLSLRVDARIAWLTLHRLVSGEGLRVDSRAALRDLDKVRASHDAEA
jgi:lipopolysaccharide/colanic/teichoic acid biosynthesis glycosyltransferase